MSEELAIVPTLPPPPVRNSAENMRPDDRLSSVTFGNEGDCSYSVATEHQEKDCISDEDLPEEVRNLHFYFRS